MGDKPIAAALDPRTPLIILLVGRKKSGKSVMASVLHRSYPYDRMTIDPTGDAEVDPITVDIDELPGRFPVDHENRAPVSVRYLADPGSDTYLDDLDRAVGLAFYHPRKRCLLWIDEVGEVTQANRTGPHMRRALQQSRHKGLSMLMCGPRPIDINPLCISQADFVYCFDLPNPKDRERVADNIGWPPREFDGAMREMLRDQGEHGYLRWDAANRELVSFPPLPLDQLATG